MSSTTPESQSALGSDGYRRPHPSAPAGAAGSPGVPDAGAQDPMVPLSIRIPLSLRKRLRKASYERDESIQDIATAAIDGELTRQGI